MWLTMVCVGLAGLLVGLLAGTEFGLRLAEQRARRALLVVVGTQARAFVALLDELRGGLDPHLIPLLDAHRRQLRAELEQHEEGS